MKISILLPYKENFSPNYAGSVSLFISDTTRLSKYKKDILIYGSTKYKNKLLKNYTNINFKKYFFKSSTNTYINKFLSLEKKNYSDLIEIHNRPEYINKIYEKNKNIIFYFHNNPLDMKSAKRVEDRYNILNKSKLIIFNSLWTLKQFKKNLNLKKNKKKLIVIYQSTSKKKINFKKKENIIIFVGRLNSSKGYDVFGRAILNILNKNPEWSSIVIGDEPREKLIFKHKRLKILGFKRNDIVSKWFSKSSISVVCSRKEEPFGRTALEASSCGCAVIISNRGGLPEASPYAIKINILNVLNLEKAIIKLVNDKKERNKLQKKIYKNFNLTNEYISNIIDNYRYKLLKNIL